MRDTFETGEPSTPDQPDTAAARTLAPSRARTVGWGLLGFVVGAVFWHFIGFWGFVADVVLKGHPDDSRVIAQTGSDCVEFALDRETGRVAPLSCPLFAPELAESRRTGREDSLRIAQKKSDRANRWSILINQDDEAPQATPAAGQQ